MPLFKKKKLTDILSSFTKTIQDLEDLKVRNKQQIADNDVVIIYLGAKNDELNKEHEAAHAVHTKISALIS
jgi:hypothetical protein